MATKQPTTDRLNDKPGLHGDVAMGSKRKLQTVRRTLKAGEVWAKEKGNLLCSLEEVIHDMQAVAEFCIEADEQIRFMITPEFWEKKQ